VVGKQLNFRIIVAESSIGLSLSDQSIPAHFNAVIDNGAIANTTTAGPTDLLTEVAARNAATINQDLDSYIFSAASSSVISTVRAELYASSPVPSSSGASLAGFAQPSIPYDDPPQEAPYQLQQANLPRSTVSIAPVSSLPQSNPAPSIVDHRMTFESFVIDDAANQLAFSTSVLVAKSPGYVINPLFIYGRSGLGKTHLLLSIRHYLEQHRPDLNVVYAQTNEMLSEYSFAATQGGFREFDQKYKTADVFLLDDVQRLENRPGTVSIVFDIFNQMKDENKQIVLSSDRPPLEINLEERFLSRFSSGVIADVQPLSAETKLTIVSNYLPYCCRRLDCENVLALIGDDVIEHIVKLSGSNIRELEGALNNLVITLKHDSDRRIPITPEEAEEVVRNHFRHLNVRDIDINIIQQTVEKYFNVRHEDVLSSKRSQEVSYPRQVAMYLCRNMTDASLPQISKAFNKDHTAVIYACNNIEKKRQLSSGVDSEVKHLVDVLTGA
jgi:chromosomal replication initiator protein